MLSTMRAEACEHTSYGIFEKKTCFLIIICTVYIFDVDVLLIPKNRQLS